MRTLRCHANLIEEFLQEEYQFVLTAKFQSDPVERRFGQYRLKSGGRFLISVKAKDISTSEKILKVMSLVKEGFDIDKSLKLKITSRNLKKIYQRQKRFLVMWIQSNSMLPRRLFQTTWPGTYIDMPQETEALYMMDVVATSFYLMKQTLPTLSYFPSEV